MSKTDPDIIPSAALHVVRLICTSGDLRLLAEKAATHPMATDGKPFWRIRIRDMEVEFLLDKNREREQNGGKRNNATKTVAQAIRETSKLGPYKSQIQLEGELAQARAQRDKFQDALGAVRLSLRAIPGAAKGPLWAPLDTCDRALAKLEKE